MIMKFLKLLIMNIKRMLTSQKIPFIVLMLGITVTSCALSIYYARSNSMLNLKDSAVTSGRVIDFDAAGLTEKESMYAIRDFFEREGFPEIAFYSVMSETDIDYDVIGIYAKEVYFVGSFCNSGFSRADDGKMQAIVPSVMMNGTGIFADERYGHKFEIKDEYMTENYEGYLYNSKRMPASMYLRTGLDKEYVEGENMINGVAIEERSVPGVFISFGDFVDCGYTPSVLRLRLSNPLSPEQKELLINGLTAAVFEKTGEYILPSDRSMKEAQGILDLSYSSDFFIYVTIVVLSLVSVMFVFAYVLRQNRFVYKSLQMMGATALKLVLLTICELAVYTVPAFTIGWLFSKIIIENTYLKHTVSYIGAAQFLLLFAVILFIACIIAVIVLYGILKRDPDGEQGDFPLASAVKKLKLKKTYLAMKSYTGTFFSELIIIIQVAFVAFVMSYSVTYLWHRGDAMRTVNRIVHDKNAVVCFRDGDYISLSSVPEYSPEVKRWTQTVENLDGVEACGYMLLAKSFGFTDENGKTAQSGFLINLSPGLINNTSLPLYKGRWFTEKESRGVDPYTDDIPVILSYSQYKKYSLTPGMTVKGLSECGNSLNEVTFKIIGVLPDDSVMYDLQTFPLGVDSIIHSPDSNNALDFDGAYTPLYIHEGERIVSGTESVSNYILFADSKDRLAEWQNQCTGTARMELAENLAKENDEFFRQSSSDYVIHAFVSLALLLVGVAGYNLLALERNKRTLGIYFISGMPWGRAVGISLGANAAIFIIGGVIGALWGVRNTMGSLTISSATKILSFCTVMAIIFVFLFITSSLYFAKLKKQQPIRIIRD